jgi:hypothetical protein
MLSYFATLSISATGLYNIFENDSHHKRILKMKIEFRKTKI